MLGTHGDDHRCAYQDMAALIGHFDRQYQHLSPKFEDQSPDYTRIAFLKARLNLFSILAAACFRSEDHLPSWGTVHLIQALRFAETIIETAGRVSQMLWSSNIPLAIYHSTFFLLKLSASRWDFVDQMRTKNSIRKAWSLLRNASRSKHDQFDRVCSVIEYMSTVGIHSSRYATSMSVSSRMASNIVYDTIYCAKERFDQRLRDAKPLDLTLAAEKETDASQTMEMGDDGMWDVLLDFPYLDMDLENLGLSMEMP